MTTSINNNLFCILSRLRQFTQDHGVDQSGSGAASYYNKTMSTEADMKF